MQYWGITLSGRRFYLIIVAYLVACSFSWYLIFFSDNFFSFCENYKTYESESEILCYMLYTTFVCIIILVNNLNK